MLFTNGTFRAIPMPVTLNDGLNTYIQVREDDVIEKTQTGITFRLLEGPDEGKTITWYGSPLASEKAGRYCGEVYAAVGFTGESFMAMMTQEARNEVFIVIADEEYKGQVRSKVKFVNDTAGRSSKAQKPASADRIREMDMRMRSILRSTPAVAAQRATNGAAGAPTPASDPHRIKL